MRGGETRQQSMFLRNELINACVSCNGTFLITNYASCCFVVLKGLLSDFTVKAFAL